MVRVVEKLFRVSVQIISFRSEMVVDHIEIDHQIFLVSGIDQTLQIVGRAVTALGRKEQDAVVTPTSLAGKICDRHQLYGGNAEIFQVIELVLNSGERSRLREGSHMKLINHALFPGAT